MGRRKKEQLRLGGRMTCHAAAKRLGAGGCQLTSGCGCAHGLRCSAAAGSSVRHASVAATCGVDERLPCLDGPP